jgi:hypothetical protein
VGPNTDEEEKSLALTGTGTPNLGLSARSQSLYRLRYPVSLALLLLLLWLYSGLLGLNRFFSFLIIYTAGRTPSTGDQHVARPLHTHRTTQTENKRTQTSMSRVGFEPTIPVFEREKTIHALDRAATVIGSELLYKNNFVAINSLAGHIAPTVICLKSLKQFCSMQLLGKCHQWRIHKASVP